MALMVAVPAYRGVVSTLYHRSYARLVGACIEARVPLAEVTVDDSLLPRVRNAMVSTFMSDDRFSHLLMVDSDMGFDPASVFRMMRSGYPIVGGIYRGRGQGDSQNKRWIVQFYDADRLPPTEHAERHEVVNGFVEVAGLGTGFLMMEKRAILTMRDTYSHLKYVTDNDRYKGEMYDFFRPEPHPVTGMYMAEDYAFCRRARLAGIRVMADTLPMLTHTGPQTWAGSFAEDTEHELLPAS